MHPQTHWTERDIFIWFIFLNWTHLQDRLLEDNAVTSFPLVYLHCGGGMKGTLCISSIPNSSSSLGFGQRKGGEEEERRQVRTTGKMCEKMLRESEGDGTRQIPQRCDREMMVHCWSQRGVGPENVWQQKDERKRWRRRLRTDRVEFPMNLPDDSHPSHSHPLSPALPCSRAKSHSRKCRPLSAQCGTAGSGHSGPCSLETPQETEESDRTE